MDLGFKGKPKNAKFTRNFPRTEGIRTGVFLQEALLYNVRSGVEMYRNYLRSLS